MCKRLSIYFEGTGFKPREVRLISLSCPVQGDAAQLLAARFKEQFQEFADIGDEHILAACALAVEERDFGGNQPAWFSVTWMRDDPEPEPTVERDYTRGTFSRVKPKRSRTRPRIIPVRNCQPRSLPLASEPERPRSLPLASEPERPRTRAECPVERPCPWVGCRYHLFLDVTSNGSIKLNFPDLEPWELLNSCALDLADEGMHTLDEIGQVMNITRERVRQIQEKAKKRAFTNKDYREHGKSIND